MKFVSYQDRKKVAAGMRAIDTAPSLEAAEVEFTNFEADFGRQYPGSVDVWRRAWNEFIPFLDYPPQVAASRVHHERDLGPSTSSFVRSPRIGVISRRMKRR
jgi:transposase-like protein